MNQMNTTEDSVRVSYSVCLTFCVASATSNVPICVVSLNTEGDVFCSMFDHRITDDKEAKFIINSVVDTLKKLKGDIPFNKAYWKVGSDNGRLNDVLESCGFDCVKENEVNKWIIML